MSEPEHQTIAQGRAALAKLEAAATEQTVESAIRAAQLCLSRDHQAGESGDPVALKLCHALAQAITKAPPEATVNVRPESAHRLRGMSLVRLYESEGRLADLIAGTDDLRKALRMCRPGEGSLRDGVMGELAVALVRLGEQTSRVSHLHEATQLLEQLQPFAATDYRLANALAVAMMRIGAMSADSSLVELAARDLQDFVKTHAPKGEAASQCARNIAAILLENARQERSSRVYRELIGVLERQVPANLLTRADLQSAQQLASAQLELGRIEIEDGRRGHDRLEAAIELLEVVRNSTIAGPRRQLEALHQLGQARFLLGFVTRNRELTGAAIGALRDALALCDADPALPDGSRPRLLNDIGNYLAAEGRLFDLPDRLAEAERHFDAALGDLSIDRAPGLYVQISLGLLDLLFRAKRWESVVQVAERVDEALTLAECDPRLSAGVRQQGSRLRTSVTRKHVSGLCALGRMRDASVMLERTRGRRIGVALEGVASDPAISDADAAAMESAEAALASALAGDDDTAIRLAWEQLARVRRSAGLDLGTRADALDDLMQSAQEGAAFVQLHFSEAGSMALCWLPGAQEPLAIELPSGAFTAIAALFQGSENWFSVYEAALQALSTGREQRARIEAWNEKITECQSVLGRVIFETLLPELVDAGLRPGTCLYLCPPGDLAAMPVGAALLPDGRSLPPQWPVAIVPNAKVLAGATRSISSAICIGGWSDGSDGHAPLPMANLEAQAIPSLVAGMSLLPADQVSRQRVLTEMASAGLVHLACHACYDPDTPAQSGLELPDGRLSLTRLASSDFRIVPTRLIYLSSCEAGMTGRTRDFDEFVGLPGALLRLGVQGVVASLWAVDDIAAFAFAQAFYRNWPGDGNCESPALAIGHAQAWMRNARWNDLLEDGILPSDMILRLRQRKLRSTLRRLEEHAQQPQVLFDSANERPFANPMHWAGWVLFGR